MKGPLRLQQVNPVDLNANYFPFAVADKVPGRRLTDEAAGTYIQYPWTLGQFQLLDDRLKSVHR